MRLHVILVCVLLVMGIPTLKADLMPLPSKYQAVACDGNYAPCDFTPFTRTPTPSDTAGLTSDAFLQYFQSRGYPYGGIFQWSAVGSNDNGYVFGNVYGGNQVHTQFIYRAGQVICCFTDEPFRLDGINDNNIVVGYDPYSGIYGPVGSFVAYAGLDADLHNVYVPILPDPVAGLPSGSSVPFLGIDKDNRILAQGSSNGQYFVLGSVPEPAGILLLASFLGILALGSKQRMRSKTHQS
jgi:hypothetical protein